MEWLLLLIPILIVCIILYRTFTFKSSVFPEMKKRHELDEKRIFESLSEMIQIPTVSFKDHSLINEKAFTNFKKYLATRYPLVEAKAQKTFFEKGILYHIKGINKEDPVVLMAHYDVVPAEGSWTHDPFSGLIDESFIHGRGTLDTKNSLCAIMEALEYHISKEKIFQHDLYIAFGGDEETNGLTALSIVNFLKTQEIKPYMVLDEGGAVVSKVFPGVTKKAAVIGIAEKGFLNVSLISKSKGGHASTPPEKQVMTNLATVVYLLNRKSIFKLQMTPAVKALFNHIAPHSKSFGIRMIFSNIWLFNPIIKLIAKLSGGQFLSLFKTTQAFTLASGSQAINVLPSEGKIGINYRLRPNDTSLSVIKKIEKIAHKHNVTVEVIEISEASKTSLVDACYHVLHKSILETFEDVIPTPYLMTATTDSRHYHEICEHVYKFSPMDITSDDLKTIHGIDEKISKQNMIDGTLFYINLIDKF